ncbi:MAG: type IA DNA topoisomerase [Anaerolineae bacterium]|nr:MAG: type IA DNA topoisomerase [Anaerolineae bacterium]
MAYIKEKSTNERGGTLSGKRITLTEKVVEEPGYRRAYTPPEKETAAQASLSRLRRGARVRLKARAVRREGLSEAALLRLMADSGVGRPSTYAETLAALRRHGYIEEREGRLVVTARGRAVLDWLRERYPFLADPAFTADLERALDALAEGRRNYADVVRSVWDRLQGQEA